VASINEITPVRTAADNGPQIADVSIPSRQETTKLLAINLYEVDLTEVLQHHWR
jgi:hypothetical protein